MGLSFLTPWMLGGALLVAAPIILHLIMRKQPKPYFFPALRFVKLRELANRRTLNLRHLLLLAARCAAILLLALALARPTLHSAGFLGDTDAPIAAALAFDASPRMEYRLENRTRLEAAREIGDWLLTQFPQESDAAILETSTLDGDFAPDLLAAKQRVEILKSNPVTRPLPDLLEAAFRLVQTKEERERKEVYLFTDLARGAWPEQAAARLQSLRGEFPDTALYLIDVGATDPKNSGLGDLKLSSQILARQGTLQIEAPVTRYGPDEEREIAVYLQDANGQLQKRGQQTLKLRAGQTETVQFRLTQLDEGTHQGVVRLLGDDALEPDNQRYFTVEVRPARRILIASPDPSADLETGYAFFLKNALDPEPLRRAKQSRFECTLIRQEQLGQQNLSEFAAVCLLDPAPLTESTAEKLRDYVAAGGGLGIWLGHNAKLDGFNAGTARELLPGPLQQQWRAGARSVYLAPGDLQHPVLAPFRGTETNNPWVEYPVLRHWQFGELDKGVNVIVNYNNRLPALLEKPLGRGKILYLTTPVSESANDPEAWNMLATGFEPWPFFVLSNEMLLYLLGNQDERFNFQPGEEVLFQIPEAFRSNHYTLTNPANDTLTQTVEQATGIMRTSATDLVGNYRLRSGGSGAGGVQRGFSVNAPAALFDLRRVTPEQLDELLGKETYRLARTREEIDRSVSAARTGAELFPLLILLVALILGGEYYLANKFYKRDKTQTETRPQSLDGFQNNENRADSTGPDATSPDQPLPSTQQPTNQQPTMQPSGWPGRAATTPPSSPPFAGSNWPTAAPPPPSPQKSPPSLPPLNPRPPQPPPPLQPPPLQPPPLPPR